MKKRLGELLVESGLISEDQLVQALHEQKRNDMKLGQFLIQSGTLKESQMVNVLANQLHIERYRADKYPTDAALADIMPLELAQRHQVAPLRREGKLLTVGMTDPMNIDVIDAVEEETLSEVEVVLCTEEELNHLITSIYGDFAGILDVLDTMDPTETIEDSDTFEVNLLQDMAEKAPVVELVNRILSQAVRDRASDIHISPEKDSIQVRFRVDGKLHDVPAPPKAMILPIVSRLKLMANMDIAVMRQPQDGRFSIKMNLKEINVRVSTLPTIYGENIVLRILDTSSGVYSLEQLGMGALDLEKVESSIRKPYGMMLSTGPTGSGKTTTLYSILQRINQPDINIITLEDPVEYRIDKIRQAQLNRQAGMTFASGIRSILRQDPDVIMVGEIRDSETASIAVQAAMTGHRVLSTLHTNNAAGAVSRFLDMGIAPFLLSSVLLLLIAQRLVRRVCPVCNEPYDPPIAVKKYWNLENDADAKFVQARGCFNCSQTGYKDRNGIFEILVIDDMVQQMILDGQAAFEITRATQQAGTLRTLKQNAGELIRRGVTTVEEAASVIII